jgi:uncharacterized membrane protein
VEQNSVKLKIWLALMKLGKLSGCHQISARSFFIGSYQFPVCARCAGLFFGQIIGILFFIFYGMIDTKILLCCTLVSLLFLGIDGLGQMKGKWVSTNFRRVVSGLLCGFFVILAVVWVFLWVAEYFKHEFF